MNLAIVFSGQGLQTYQHVNELITYAEDKHIRKSLEQGLPEIFTNNLNEIDIYSNQIAQPLIFALQWCRWQKIKDISDNIVALSGYSLGELSAFICSTETDLETGLALARQRAKFMTNAISEQGGLVSVQGLNIERLNPILQLTGTELSIKLNDSNCIVGGLTPNLEKFNDHARLAGAQVKPLSVSIPSHTSMMHLAVEPYQIFFKQFTFDKLQFPIVSGSRGIKVYNPIDAINNLIFQMNHLIEWDLCLESLKENLPDIVIEIGPGNALSKMILETQPSTIVRSIDEFKTWGGFETWFKRVIES